MSLDDFNDSAVVQGTLRLARHFSLRLLMDMGPVHVAWLWIGLGVRQLSHVSFLRTNL